MSLIKQSPFMRTVNLPSSRTVSSFNTSAMTDETDRYFVSELLALFQSIPKTVYGLDDCKFTSHIDKDEHIHIRYDIDRKNDPLDFIDGLEEELSHAGGCGVGCLWNPDTKTFIIKDAHQLYRTIIYLHDELKDTCPIAAEVIFSTACSIYETYHNTPSDLDEINSGQYEILKALQGILNQFDGTSNFSISPLKFDHGLYFQIGCNDSPFIELPENKNGILRDIFDTLEAMEESAPLVSFEMRPCGDSFVLGIDDLEDIIPLLSTAYRELNIDPNITEGPKCCLTTPSEVLGVIRYEKNKKPFYNFH